MNENSPAESILCFYLNIRKSRISDAAIVDSKCPGQRTAVDISRIHNRGSPASLPVSIDTPHIQVRMNVNLAPPLSS